MTNSQRNHLLVSATPLLALGVLLILFVVPVRRYVQCLSGNCVSIVNNLSRVLATNSESTRTLQSTDTDEMKGKINERQRVGLMFSGRVNFLFLLVVYFSVCALAFVVGCFIIWKSLAHANVKPANWLVAAIAISIVLNVVLYFFPTLYFSLFLSLIGATIQNDLSAAEHLLVLVNSFGFATVLLLTLASCATLYARNDATYPENLRQISQQMKHLQLVLYVGTFMLVSGVLLIQSVYQWSLAFTLRDEQSVKIAEGFFSTLLSLQGAFFTLVLAAVYLPAAFILRHRADSLSGLPQSKARKEKVLKSYNLSFSFTQSLPRIAAILGPLVAGPVGELFSRLG